MTYSSSLTDAEWKILEPLLLQILPRSSEHDLQTGQSERFLMESSINIEELEKVYPQIMTKSGSSFPRNPLAQEKAAQGKSGESASCGSLGPSNGQTLGWSGVKAW
jgi:hypothetical protein